MDDYCHLLVLHMKVILFISHREGNSTFIMNNKLTIKWFLIYKRLNSNNIILSLNNSRVDGVRIIGFMYL